MITYLVVPITILISFIVHQPTRANDYEISKFLKLCSYVKYFSTKSNAIQGPVAVQVQEAIVGSKNV